ncbi:MAG TPA: carbon-nitrogen hydrolase family protein [Nitrososphaerales archaeon]|nr:carbon-nitrogen hydrolase family protein [Nitrososphaerales archaeon]
MTRNFTITCAQIDCKLGDTKANLSKIRNLSKEIFRKRVHPNLVCFPELATTGYSLGKKWRDLADEVPGNITDELSKIAAECGFNLLCGIDEKGTEGRIYDSAVLIDPSGKIFGTYRKVHLWGEERKYFTPGESFPIFKIKLFRFGIGICYDLEFPESTRTMAKKGAQLAIFPSAEPSHFQKTVDNYILSRSSENCIFVAFSNRVGRERKDVSFFGHSQIASPDGRVVMARRKDGFVSATLDPRLLSRMKRKLLPYLDQMESRAYH